MNFNEFKLFKMQGVSCKAQKNNTFSCLRSPRACMEVESEKENTSQPSKASAPGKAMEDLSDENENHLWMFFSNNSAVTRRAHLGVELTGTVVFF